MTVSFEKNVVSLACSNCPSLVWDTAGDSIKRKIVLYHQDTSKHTVGTELDSKCYNTGQGLLNDTRTPWMLNAECLLWYENNEARHGACGSHGEGVEVGRWKPVSVLEHESLSKAAGSLLSLDHYDL